MYQLATNQNTLELLSFFEQDLTHCLYSYIDLKKYGMDHKELQIYYYKEQDKLTAVATKYYNGLQLFHKQSSFPLTSTVALINQLKPTIISSTLDVIDALSSNFTAEYDTEKGFVSSLSKVRHQGPFTLVQKASLEDMEEIAAFICSDEGLGGHYTIDALKEQLSSRYKENFGRNYMIRKDGVIICHAATYAEIDNLAVISGVITHPDHRGKGYAYDLVSKLCMDLLLEGKQPHLFYYTKEAEGLYQRIGFETPSNWAKLAKKNHE